VYKQGEAQTDKARFKRNTWLGERPRQLFLKGDLADRGQKLFEALRDQDKAVVAAVFNAVDDQIGSENTGTELRISPDEIIAFKPSLRAALDAGRRVLLTADHGYTAFVDKEGKRGKASAHRYIELEDQDAAPEGYLEIDVGGLGGKPARRAFAWKQGVYHGRPQVGFHGGCALEEMVVPLAWLERDGLQANEPGWWFGGASAEEVVSAPPQSIEAARGLASPGQAP